MKTSVACKTILTTLALMLAIPSSGQDSLSFVRSYPSGIFIHYGLGDYAIKDEYISKEKYSGTLPWYSFGWARQHNKYVYRLEMIYRNSKEIHNYGVTAEITQLNLIQGFLYPMKRITLLRKDLHLWLGPTTEFFINYNKPYIAVSGFDYAQSYAALFSLGFKADAVLPLSSRIQLGSSVGTTVLSLGFRTVDNEEDNQSPVKPLTLFSGLNASFDLGIRYYLLKNVSLKAAYRMEVTRISGWEKILAASNNAILGINYRFKN